MLYMRDLKQSNFKRLKTKTWTKMHQANGQNKKATVAILELRKIDIRKY